MTRYTVVLATLLIIGHRGAAGHRPEHTLAGYRLAAGMGADYIEPDLVATKDGVLIARHENQIGETTDVADRFPERRRTKEMDGKLISGWFTEDFTLAEIKTLRARERLPFRSHRFDGKFEVPTFREVIELAQQLGRELGRPIGIYPETKHPTYFRDLGLPLEGRLVSTLALHGWNSREAPVFIQSFEASSLSELRRLTAVRLIQLIDEGGKISDADVREVASYADGIGINRSLATDDLVRRAHFVRLLVHVWTLADDPAPEYRRYRDFGVDGIFTDFPDVAFSALR